MRKEGGSYCENGENVGNGEELHGCCRKFSGRCKWRLAAVRLGCNIRIQLWSYIISLKRHTSTLFEAKWIVQKQ
jgi:hypothetical protein